MTIEELTEEQQAEVSDNGFDEDAFLAYADLLGSVEDALESFADAYQGEFDSDEQFAQNLAEEIGAIQGEVSWPYTCIDWAHAARELMYDYCSESGYYFRNV